MFDDDKTDEERKASSKKWKCMTLIINKRNPIQNEHCFTSKKNEFIRIKFLGCYLLSDETKNEIIRGRDRV